MCPSGGIDKIAPFAALFGANQLNVAALCDIAQGDKAKVERLRKGNVLRAGHVLRAEQTGYDNWNGGADIWEIRIEMPAPEFARLGTKRTQLEEQIGTRLKTILENETQDWYSAKLVPARVKQPDWRSSTSTLPRQVRMNILDGMRLERVSWSGSLDNVEFLSRLFDLQQLPSTDDRFEDAAGDIWQPFGQLASMGDHNAAVLVRDERAGHTPV